MTRKELNVAIFEGTAEGVLWQPRLETWIGHYMECGTLPERFRDMTNLEIYDALGCSIRYLSCAYASTWIEKFKIRDDMVVIEEQHPNHTISRVRTPAGEICTVLRDIWKNGRRVNHRIEKFPVKTVKDLRVAIDIVNRQRFRVNLEGFHRAAKVMGHRGEPAMILSGSGFTELIKGWCGLPGTYYLLHDNPIEVEAYLEKLAIVGMIV